VGQDEEKEMGNPFMSATQQTEKNIVIFLGARGEERSGKQKCRTKHLERVKKKQARMERYHSYNIAESI
jgi:hypothetical protein